MKSFSFFAKPPFDAHFLHARGCPAHSRAKPQSSQAACLEWLEKSTGWSGKVATLVRRHAPNFSLVHVLKRPTLTFFNPRNSSSLSFAELPPSDFPQRTQERQFGMAQIKWTFGYCSLLANLDMFGPLLQGSFV